MARANIYVRKHNESAWSKLTLGQKSELVNRAIESQTDMPYEKGQENSGVIPMAVPPMQGMQVEPITGMTIPPMQPMPTEERQVNRSCPTGWLIPEGRDKCMVKKCRSCRG